MARIDTLDNFVTDMAAAIKNKTGRTDPITPANFDTEIESIESGGDTSMEDGLIEGILTEYSNDRVTIIRQYAFYNYKTITKFNLPNVNEIESDAFGYTKPTYFYAPKLTKVGESAFYQSYIDENIFDLSTLVEIANSGFKFNNFVTINCPSLTTIGREAFASNWLLENVSLEKIAVLPYRVFYDCMKLSNVNIPNVTELEEGVFYGSNKLQKIDLPKVTLMNRYVFYNNKVLDTLILRSNTMCSLSNTNSFTNTPIASGTGYIYVPRALIEDYKVATNWTTYANQFRAIEDYPEIYGEVS